MKEKQILYIGAIIHYTTDGGKCSPAIVTFVNKDGTIDISVVEWGRVAFKPIYRIKEMQVLGKENTWHWPEIIVTAVNREETI